VSGGFIHVPYLPEQAPDGAPSMALAQIVEGLKVAIEVAVRGGADVVEAGGATH
jgi:pyroglutamyl-peptidase